MPTYDYVCDRCGHAFEHFQGINEPLLRKCPQCGKPALRRLIGTGAGVLFKGSGFYETDYKRKAAPAGESQPADAGGGKSGEPREPGGSRDGGKRDGGKKAAPADKEGAGAKGEPGGDGKAAATRKDAERGSAPEGAKPEKSSEAKAASTRKGAKDARGRRGS
jgi:putative FmdB family regulatory protein